MAELISDLNATLVTGLSAKAAEKLLRSLEDELMLMGGLYLDGELLEGEPRKIGGVITRADGTDLTERDRAKVENWLVSRREVTRFEVGPLKPADP
jgi:uncharacterized protein YggL (DUF469 family)